MRSCSTPVLTSATIARSGKSFRAELIVNRLPRLYPKIVSGVSNERVLVYAFFLRVSPRMVSRPATTSRRTKRPSEDG